MIEELTKRLKTEYGLDVNGEDGSLVVRDRNGRFVVRITSELVTDDDTLERAMELAAAKIVLMRMGLWSTL